LEDIGPGLDGEHVIARDGVVLQVVQDVGFALEKRHHVGMARHLRPHQLDGDRIAAGRGDALVDFAHAAFGDQAFDLEHAAVQPYAGAKAPLRRRLKDSLVVHACSCAGSRSAATSSLRAGP
jgi:hypothetical protein